MNYDVGVNLLEHKAAIVRTSIVLVNIIVDSIFDRFDQIMKKYGSSLHYFLGGTKILMLLRFIALGSG